MPASLIVTGGATAEAVLDALGLGCLEVLGEALPGMPLVRAGRLAMVTKSGGFGTPSALARLAGPRRRARRGRSARGPGVTQHRQIDTGRKSLSDLIFERLERAIKSGAYAPDEKLPTEHDLAAEFEVSRPVVRAALQRLRDQRLIYSRQGAGSFVRQLGLRQPLGFGNVESIADLQRCYEFRLTLEPEAAASAAERHGSEQLAEDPHRPGHDARCHPAQAAPRGRRLRLSSGHRAGQRQPVFRHRHGGAEGPYRRRHAVSRPVAEGHADGLAHVYGEHEGIFEAIRDQEAEQRARALMRRHLEGSRDRLFQGRRPADAGPGAAGPAG